MSRTPGSVRRWFRAMRTDDHRRDANQLFALQQYAYGQHVWTSTEDKDATLFDVDVLTRFDTEAYVRELRTRVGWCTAPRQRVQACGGIVD